MFCQNWDISQGAGSQPGQVRGQKVTIERLREIAFELKAQGAHNINLVSPTPYSEMIREALLPAKEKLGIPIVWNSNAYELVSTLKSLEPLVDVYLPDLKLHDPGVSKRYCGTRDYFEYASKAVGEMWRQKREFRLQNDSTLSQGVVIRHLVIPGQVEDSERILGWIADNIGTEVHISLMAQYTPVHRAAEFPEVNRRLRHSEYDAVCDYFSKLGFENGLVQELTSASSEYTPDFDLKGV
jgi:putative pyruvate formate lyase activating enzyme